jgi:hypothetical protein
MNFPHVPSTPIFHAHGGDIVKVHGIAHRLGKPSDGYSRDYWFFDCEVKWHDGSGTTEHAEVPPHALSAENPSEHADLNALMAALTVYLGEHGTWREVKPKGWYAHRKVAA